MNNWKGNLLLHLNVKKLDFTKVLCILISFLVGSELEEVPAAGEHFFTLYPIIF